MTSDQQHMLTVQWYFLCADVGNINPRKKNTLF